MSHSHVQCKAMAHILMAKGEYLNEAFGIGLWKEDGELRNPRQRGDDGYRELTKEG